MTTPNMSDLDQNWVHIENDHLPVSAPKGRFASWMGRISQAAKSQIKSLTNDTVSEQIKKTTELATKEVTQKLHDLLYLDPDRYGKDAQGRHVKIYTHQSRAVDALFKQVMGQDLQTLFNQLPFPLNTIAGTLRKKLEQRIIDGILNKVSSLTIQPAIQSALMSGYDFSAAQIAKAMNETKGAQKPEVSFDKKAEAPTDNELRELQRVQQALDANGDEISLEDVISYYENKIIDHVNDKIRENLVPAIGNAAHKVGLKSSGAALKKASNTLLAGVALQPLLPAGLGLISPLAGLALKYKAKELKNRFASEMGAFASKVAERNVPQQFISRVPEKGVSTHLDEEFDALVMDYTAPTLTNYLSQKASNATHTVGNAVSKGFNWLYDNFVGSNSDDFVDEDNNELRRSLYSSSKP